ncbi:MAG: UbiA family prenyltransferase [Polynucleobacter sp.]|nr:UbiA family prenyltransferase [Polynucleobacter sp.]
MTAIPLAVDLDGTLILTDTLHESAVRALRSHPLQTLQIPLWLAQGKAFLKQRLANLTEFDATALPYNHDLLVWLKEQRALGRRLILCTASDRLMADAVASHLGIFDEVMASDGVNNLSALHKAAALKERFGHQGFDYAGNSADDLPVWSEARHAIVVNASTSVQRLARERGEVEKEFPSLSLNAGALPSVLRMHQWLKNLLLFIAPLAAHQAPSADLSSMLLLAFFSFSLCASAVYIANDLFDLDSDRHHPRKRLRPFASGRVSVAKGVVLFSLLLLNAFLFAIPIGSAFVGWLLFYFLLTCAYSWGLKRVVLIDCLVLAMLYTVRIIAGAAAAGISLSFWLLAFSVFLFLSLAFVKRYAELKTHADVGRDHAHGRGYWTSDAPLVQSLGITSGYAAVVVLALYLNSDAVVKLYQQPVVMWSAVPVMLFWISWMWMKAHRGEMHDDPLLFAVRDKASLLSGCAFALVLFIATRGISW